jgi:stage V sporulation protein B
VTPGRADPGAESEGSLGARVVGLAAVRVVSVAFGFLTGIIGARLLGADGVGAAGIAIVLASVAAIVSNGGLNISTIYLLGTRPADGRRLIAGLVPLAVGGALLAAIVLVVVGGLLASSIGLPGRTDLLLGAAALAAVIVLFEFAGAGLLGLGHSRAYTATELVRGAGTFVATALILVGVWRTDTGFVLAAVVALIAATAFAGLRVVRTLGVAEPRVDRGLAAEALSIGLRGQVGNALQFLNLRLDQLMVPVFLTVSSAGVYFIAVRVSESLALAGSAVGSLIFPEVARAADPSGTSVTELAVRVTALTTAAGAVVVGLVADPFMAVAFGPPFTEGTTALRILLVAMVPLSVLRVLAGDLKGRGRPGTVSIAMGITLIVTVLLDVTLIPRFGISGAATASVISYSAGAIVLAVVFTRITGARAGALLPGPSDVGRIALFASGAMARGRRP